jgi:hypothetical protein
MVFYIRIFEVYMEKCGLNRYASVKAALNEVGFKVDEIKKLANRIIITVSPKKQGVAPSLLQKNSRRHLK